MLKYSISTPAIPYDSENETNHNFIDIYITDNIS